MEQNDLKCPYCWKHVEARDYSMVRQSRIQKRSDFNFKEIFAKNDGQLKRAEKEETIELALPGAFSLDSEDSPSLEGSEQEILFRYSGLGPTCIRFLGLHRVLPQKPRDPPHNFALVAIGTRSNPFTELWSSSGAFCEEHLQDLCVPLKGPSDKIRSDKDFQTFSCEFCHKKGMHSAVGSLPKPFRSNLHKVVSRRAALRLMLLDEKPPQEEDCSFLEENFFFHWKIAPFSEQLGPKTANSYLHDTHMTCAIQSPTEFNKDNWLIEIQKRFKETCDSSAELQGYASSVINSVMKELKRLESTSPYFNPNFKETLKNFIFKAITESDNLPNSSPHRSMLAEFHADIISTILSQSPQHRNHHFLRLDQLKASSGFFECEAINKHVLLESSVAQAKITKIPKLSAIFTDERGIQLLPAIDLIGISDSWLYAAGDPYLRCDKCSCESARNVVIIGQNQGAQPKFYQLDKWTNMQVKAIINGNPFECKVLRFESENKVKLTEEIPPDAPATFVLSFEYPLHVLAGDLRVRFDAGDKVPILIMQALQGGDYAMPQAIPSPNLFSIRAIFSSKPNASPFLECQQYWKFRIGGVACYPVPVFHHFWGKCPMLAHPWKNAHFQPRSNNYCVVPPQGNCILNDLDIAHAERQFVIGQCYHYFDPDVAERYCSIPDCSVCRKIDSAVPKWLPARCDLCNDFIPLIDCVTDVGQSKWGLHFERDSIVSPSHNSNPQGGVLFVYVPANLGKVQRFKPEVLGFVGTSSPVLSMDIIERETFSKTVFVNGFREIFESLLVSCLDGRIFVVNSPRVPIFESFEAPSYIQQKSSDHLRSIDLLKSYLKEQLQDSSQQHALFNGSVIDYVLRFEHGSSSNLKSVICPPSVFCPDVAGVSFKCEDLLKNLQQSFSKSIAAQKHFISQEAGAAHRKTSLEQLLLRRLFVNMNIRAALSVDKGKTLSKEVQALQTKDSLTSSLSLHIKIVEEKISKAFFECLLKIYRLHQLPLEPAITALNFMSCRRAILNSAYKNVFTEMNGALNHARKTVIRSLGFQNSTVHLSRAELYFLQSIRDEFDPFQNPSVSSQMALELLTPVCGLRCLQAHARSVHFIGSENGWFQVLALVSLSIEGMRYESRIYHYKLRIPFFQLPEQQSCPDFLSSWLPHHSSFVEVQKSTLTSSHSIHGSYIVQTKCPHGLHTGDTIRFLDSGNVTQNPQLFRVLNVDNLKCSFTVEGVILDDSLSETFMQPKEGSFVQLQPRFFPFQKLEQVEQRISSTENCSQVKCLIVRKKPNNFRQAVWIELSDSSPRRCEYLHVWSADAPTALAEKFIFSLPTPDPTPCDHAPRGTSVECACFLQNYLPSEHDAIVALGCSWRDMDSRGSGVESQLYIWRHQNPHHFAKVNGTLPRLTHLKLLPTDDATDLLGHDGDRQSSFILVAATKLTEFNESAFFLHVTMERTGENVDFNVKCFRSINEIRATSLSKKSAVTTPLRASYPTFCSIDVIPIRSNAHPATQPHIDDSWLYFNDSRIKYIAKVHETNRPLNLFQFERDGIVCSQWAITDKVRLLDALKAEHFFIQFLPNPTGRLGRLFYETNLRHKIYQIPAIEEKNRSSERDSSFVVSTSSPQGRQILSQIPSDDFPFQVVVPSDIDGEYGHESGIAKFAFFLDSPSLFANPAADYQFRAKTRLFAVPLRSWFPRLVQGKFGNNLN